MTVNLATASAASLASTLATSIGASSTLKFYSGSKPATPETAASGTLLATVTVTSVSASGAVITSSDPAAVSPVAAGTAGYARLATSGGTTILDCDVSTSGADINLSTTALTTSVPLDMAPFTITVPGV